MLLSNLISFGVKVFLGFHVFICKRENKQIIPGRRLHF
jgi:hypothetical protein